jgi:glucose/arabinose dehydrogenase
MSSERGSSERGRAQRWLVLAACSMGLAVSGCAVEAGSVVDDSAVDDSPVDATGSADAAESGEGAIATEQGNAPAGAPATPAKAPAVSAATRASGEKTAIAKTAIRTLKPNHGAGAKEPTAMPAEGPLPHPAGADMLSQLTVPPGFEIDILTAEIPGAGMLASHGSHVYVTRPAYGEVLRLDDSDGDGFAEWQEPMVTDLPNVQAIAFNYDQVFLATNDRVYRARIDTLGRFEPVTAITDQLPSCDNQRYRGLGVGPDLSLYLSIAADCASADTAAAERGSLLRIAFDGSSLDVFARGLRNTLGFAWHPVSRELWGMDPSFERKETVPDELNKIEEGGDYGAPYCYADAAVEPDAAEPPESDKEAYCAGTLPSVLEYVEQGSAMGMAFYAGKTFPAEYVGDAFVALHGSWSSSAAAGYKVIRVRFRDGVPVGFEDFVTGFLMDGVMSFGRPTGIAVAHDGALVFSDDQNGMVYRVAYRG